jgi:hypothetical protein
MFVHMEPVRTERHLARGNTYEFAVYRVIETGEHRVFISKNSEGLEMLAAASGEVVSDGKSTGTDVVEILLQAARDEVDSNEWGKY